MKKFEYKWIKIHFDKPEEFCDFKHNVEKEFNLLGSKGWEICSNVKIDELQFVFKQYQHELKNMPVKLTFMFKREIPKIHLSYKNTKHVYLR